MTELFTTVQNPSDEELKPCPFCGSPAHIYAKQGKSKGWYDVGCSKFGCISMGQSFRSAEEATEAWNRRAKE